MSSIIKRDPFWGHLLSWPRWLDDFEEPMQKGLRIHETDDNIVAEAVVAGVPSENIEVNIENGILRIKAGAEIKEEGKNKHQVSTYQYYYSVALSGGEWDKAKAEVEDGIVKISVPKIKAAKPKRITVKAKGKK